MLREGSGEPLVLLHGVLCSERVWKRVMPLLAPHHDVIALTALCHVGGSPPSARPVMIEHMVDEAERQLDELGLERPHLVGNSMGGWMALELARRGRARSVCALSPAGTWEIEWRETQRVLKMLTVSVREARRGRRLVGTLARSKRFRRWTMRDGAVHGERITRAELLEFVDDMIGCEAVEDMLATTARCERLDPVPCPITLAWSEHDRLFPVARFGAHARQLIPGARFVVVPGVGHIPMVDNPWLVADTILEVSGARPLAAGTTSSVAAVATLEPRGDLAVATAG